MSRMNRIKKRELQLAKQSKKAVEATYEVCDVCHKPKPDVRLQQNPFEVEMSTPEERESLGEYNMCRDCAQQSAEEI